MGISHYQSLCTLTSDALRVPSYIVTDQWEAIQADEGCFNPIYESLQASLSELADNHVEGNITFHTTRHLENYLTIPIPESKGYLIVGPAIYPTYTKDRIKNHLDDCHITDNKEAIIQFYETLPRLSKNEFVACAHLLHLTICNEALAEDNFSYAVNADRKEERADPTQIITKRRVQQTQHHHHSLAEKKIIDSVRAGQSEQVKQALLEFPEELYGVLSKRSYLRSHKNIVIAAITLATRSAIEGGLESEVALTISDLYIQKLEDLLSIEEVKKLHLDALCDLADRVASNKKDHYSKPIRICLYYIFKHLYKDISLDKLAEVTKISPSYLSFLFKKEVGVTPSSYIQQTKVEEAKKLLAVTELSLLDISVILNFYDQSHFSKTFKKHTGQTPRQFRLKPKNFSY